MSTYLWQNFLTDSTIRHRIADKAKDFYDRNNCETLIEIWPGKWSITKLILNISLNFTLFEKDETLKEILEEVLSKKESWTAKIIWWDVLDWDLSQFEWKKKSDFCRVKFAILYYFSNSQKVFLIWKRGVYRLTFYGSRWSLTKTPLRCWEKIISILDPELCLWGPISQNCSCKSILSCSKS